MLGVSVTTVFYTLSGVLGYGAFGNSAPGNLLTGFGFYNPFWVVDFANACVVVHLVGAYQVFVQPLFAFIEEWCSRKWPRNQFIHKNYHLNIPGYGLYKANLFRLVWRTGFVISKTLISMLLPFFNDVVGILGAVGFLPLTVYFLVEMYTVQKKIIPFSSKWILLQSLSVVSFFVSLATARGSIEGIIQDMNLYKPFRTTD